MLMLIHSDTDIYVESCVGNIRDPTINSLSEKLYGAFLTFPSSGDNLNKGYAVDPTDTGPFAIGPHAWSDSTAISGVLCNGVIHSLSPLYLFTVTRLSNYILKYF